MTNYFFMNIDKDMLLWIAKTIEEFRVSSKKQSEKIIKDNVPVDKRFSWGHVLDRFEYDFDGRTMEVIKYHSWKKDKGTLIVGDADESVIHYHCEELNESTESRNGSHGRALGRINMRLFVVLQKHLTSIRNNNCWIFLVSSQETPSLS